MRKKIEFPPYEEAEVKEIYEDGGLLCEVYGEKQDDGSWIYEDRNVLFPAGSPVLLLEESDYLSILKAKTENGSLVLPENEEVDGYKTVVYSGGFPEKGKRYRMVLSEDDDTIRVSWEEFIPESVEPDSSALQSELVAFARMSINTMALSDEQSLSVVDLYPGWEELIGQEVEAGIKMRYGEKLWKVMQKHTVQEQYKPGQGTESLYSEIVESHAGTEDDPIPYSGNMVLEKGKYYTQNCVIYHCTRNTEIPVYQSLSELVGIYVELLKNE